MKIYEAILIVAGILGILAGIGLFFIGMKILVYIDNIDETGKEILTKYSTEITYINTAAILYMMGVWMITQGAERIDEAREKRIDKKKHQLS